MEEKESCRISDLLNQIRSIHIWVELPYSLKKIKFIVFLSVLCSQTSRHFQSKSFAEANLIKCSVSALVQPGKQGQKVCVRHKFLCW